MEAERSKVIAKILLVFLRDVRLSGCRRCPRISYRCILVFNKLPNKRHRVENRVN